MPISIACPACSKPVLVPEQAPDAGLLCPHCRQPLELPSAEMAEKETPEGEGEPSSEASADAVTAAEEAGFDFGHAPPAFVDELLDDHRSEDRIGPRRFNWHEWESVRHGLNLLGASTLTIVIVQILQFITNLSIPAVFSQRREAEILTLLVLATAGLLNLCASIIAFWGVWLTCRVPSKSGLLPRATSAFVSFVLSIGSVIAAASLLLTLGIGLLPLVAFLAGGLAFLIGLVLYLLFLGDLASHLGHGGLAREFATYLVFVLFFYLGIPVAVACAWIVLATSFRDFELYQQQAVQVIGMGVFALSVLLNLRFFFLVRQLRGRMDHVIR
jgi:hypothetical protein